MLQIYSNVFKLENIRTGSELSTDRHQSQARRQDSVTRGEIFGGAREVYLCEFERSMGARKIYPSLGQINKVKTKD